MIKNDNLYLLADSLGEDNYFDVVLTVVLISLAIAGLIVLIIYLLHIYDYPKITIEVDITNKRVTNTDDAFDFYVTNYGKADILSHAEDIEKWKNKQIVKANGNAKKIERLNRRWDKISANAFTFEFYRCKTRYKQVNYEKIPQKINEVVYRVIDSDKNVLARINFLEKHGMYVTYSNYNRVDQRKALTKELKDYIKKRDNYTCQRCGKYMPDEVGLHIDHIIPISRGGRSIPSNLQVLCSKCNGRKGNKR